MEVESVEDEEEEATGIVKMDLDSEDDTSFYWNKSDMGISIVLDDDKKTELGNSYYSSSSSAAAGDKDESAIKKNEQKVSNYNESENETKMDIVRAITEADDEEFPPSQSQRDIEEADDNNYLKAVDDDTITSNANVIKPIDRVVVHQICSGQVIVTLSTAVKELVENAIDAGATSVEIRLCEYGSKVIEVIDNGSGVDEANFQGLALKHHTSKISDFEDLTSVTTFGFRGEALSSLCAMSNLTVITKSKFSESKTGFKIEYDASGRIVSKCASAREFGTTVILKNIFAPLPVRRQEFLKNLKREFHKMVNVLYGYCLIAQGVRIMATNQVGNGSFNKIVSVPASKGMKERILSLFGTKQLQSLMEFKQTEVISEETLSEFGLSEKTFMGEKYKIHGYISVPHQGRSSNDRQYYFVNSRPCDPAKISRITNEVYHGYSKSQSPFVCLNIKTKEDNVDVNVTPDKRVLYLQSEKSLFCILKASLICMYTSESSSFNLSAGREILTFSQSQSQSDSQLFEELKCKIDKKVEFCGDEKTFACQFSSFGDGSTSRSSSSPKTNSRNFLQRFARNNTTSGKSQLKDSDDDEVFKRFSQPYKRSKTEISFGSQKQSKVSDFLYKSSSNKVKVEDKHSDNVENENDLSLSKMEENEDPGGGGENCSETSSILCWTPTNSQEVQTQSTYYNSSQSQLESEEAECIIVYDDELQETEGVEFEKGPSVTVSIDWNAIKCKLKSKMNCNSESENKNYARKFRAKIAPGENEAAEQELKRQLTKDMFSQMHIIGQFNLGFILVKSGPDLFIVDQHASDEKYNFEDLEKTTVMQTQLLISPLELQLPAVSENIILNNLDVFQKNGFDFEINLDGEPTNRVKLTKIPYSKSCQFGKSDVDELIFMMEDGPENCFCRPSKVRMMLASRACRKSVMIGTALGMNEMRKIVNHMGEMDQPWNCPHGRPTIRHLLNMNILPDMDLRSFNHYRSPLSQS